MHQIMTQKGNDLIILKSKETDKRKYYFNLRNCDVSVSLFVFNFTLFYFCFFNTVICICVCQTMCKWKKTQENKEICHFNIISNNITYEFRTSNQSIRNEIEKYCTKNSKSTVLSEHHIADIENEQNYIPNLCLSEFDTVCISSNINNDNNNNDNENMDDISNNQIENEIQAIVDKDTDDTISDAIIPSECFQSENDDSKKRSMFLSPPISKNQVTTNSRKIKKKYLWNARYQKSIEMNDIQECTIVTDEFCQTCLCVVPYLLCLLLFFCFFYFLVICCCVCTVCVCVCVCVRASRSLVWRKYVNI